MLLDDVDARRQRYADLAKLVGQPVSDEDRQRVTQLVDPTSREHIAKWFRGDQAPVRQLDVDAAADPVRALAIEVTENEKRRDYTKGEIQSLAERLKQAGFKANRGRPKAGERALIPALEAIVGKSKATIWRCLTVVPPTVKPEIVSDETISSAVAKLLADARKFRVKTATHPIGQSLESAIQALERHLEKAQRSLKETAKK